jgi:hypothetical protein
MNINKEKNKRSKVAAAIDKLTQKNLLKPTVSSLINSREKAVVVEKDNPKSSSVTRRKK